MKKEVVKGLAKLGLLVVMTMIAAGTSAKAQTLEYKLTANIPFDFTVADKKFQAGEYSISRAQATAGDTVVRISSADGHANINRITVPVIRLTAQNKATLVFHRYGEEYFLFQVWPAGANTGRVLPKSRGERDAQQKANDNMVGMAATRAPHTEMVTIVADLP
jgi:hypothetical protein